MKEEISEAINNTKGRFFVIKFTKKDGTERTMVCRTGVRAYTTADGERKELTGKGMSWNPNEREMRVVWDIQKKAYRLVNLRTTHYFKCGDTVVTDTSKPTGVMP